MLYNEVGKSAHLEWLTCLLDVVSNVAISAGFNAMSKSTTENEKVLTLYSRSTSTQVASLHTLQRRCANVCLRCLLIELLLHVKLVAEALESSFQLVRMRSALNYV